MLAIHATKNIKVLIPLFFSLSWVWKNMLCNVCLGFFGADVILSHAKVWDLAIRKCPGRSTTQRSNMTSTACRNGFKIPEMCRFTLTSTVLQLFLQNLLIILSFLLESSSVKMFQAFYHLSIYFESLQLPSRVGKVNTIKTPEMNLCFDSVVWGGCLTIIFVRSFHYFKFLATLHLIEIKVAGQRLASPYWQHCTQRWEEHELHSWKRKTLCG